MRVSQHTWIGLTVTHSGRVTTAVASHADYIASGASIQHEDDDHDPKIGDNLAVGRALVDLGKALMRDAHKASNRKAKK